MLQGTVIQTAARETDGLVTGGEEWSVAAMAIGACGGEECVKGLVGPHDSRWPDGADEFPSRVVGCGPFSARADAAGTRKDFGTARCFCLNSLAS